MITSVTREPSKVLLEKIRECAEIFMGGMTTGEKVQKLVSEVTTQGETEGFDKYIITHIIHKHMVAFGLRDRSATRWLPPELKFKYTRSQKAMFQKLDSEPHHELDKSLQICKHDSLETRTPGYLHAEAIYGLRQAWTALTGLEDLPQQYDDVIVDYVKPTRDHRLRLLIGLNEYDATELAYQIANLTHLLKDTLIMWKENIGDRRSRNGISQ